MKLTEAVAILNACAHGGGSDWIIADTSATGTEPLQIASEFAAENLTAFEAIAIAEKYKDGETPESIRQDVLDEVAAYS